MSYVKHVSVEEIDQMLEEMDKLIKETAVNLNRMVELQQHLHNQYGQNNTDFNNLQDAINSTLDGWMSSNC